MFGIDPENPENVMTVLMILETGHSQQHFNVDLKKIKIVTAYTNKCHYNFKNKH